MVCNELASNELRCNHIVYHIISLKTINLYDILFNRRAILVAGRFAGGTGDLPVFEGKMATAKCSQSEIAAQLERRRRALGMSLPILAQRSGASLPTVNRILRGAADRASYATLKAVARALGMDFELRSTIGEYEFAEQQARVKAEVVARMVQGTSALESQAVDADTYRQIVAQTVHALMAGSRRRLWSPG